MLGLSAGGVGGTFQVVRSVLPPLYLSKQGCLYGSSCSLRSMDSCCLGSAILHIQLVESHPLAQVVRHVFPVERPFVGIAEYGNGCIVSRHNHESVAVAYIKYVIGGIAD